MSEKIKGKGFGFIESSGKDYFGSVVFIIV